MYIQKLWKHSGFNVDDSARVKAGDRQGRVNFSRYLIQAPFSLDKIQYSADSGSVIYDEGILIGEQYIEGDEIEIPDESVAALLLKSRMKAPGFGEN